MLFPRKASSFLRSVTSATKFSNTRANCNSRCKLQELKKTMFIFLIYVPQPRKMAILNGSASKCDSSSARVTLLLFHAH